MIIICITVLLVVTIVCITTYFINLNGVKYQSITSHYQKVKDISVISMNEFSRNQDIINDYDDDNQLKIAAENLLNALDTINTITRNI